jgi:serine/threonine protein kinase/tetratricopeptide (TPR) repeat protein
MVNDANAAARRARDTTAVSSGDSSIPQQPALTPDGSPRTDLTPGGVDFDATLPQGAVSPVPLRPPVPEPQAKSDPSNDVTMAEIRRPRDPSSGTTQQVFASIGATIFEVGSILGGRYEIQKLLGMGGMGAVYKAHDLEVDRAVGLKVIRPDLAGNPAILARFKQELVLARQVTHKNIIRIYDLSEAEGVKFITMEFIEGEDLRTILTRDGKISPNDAIGIIRQACAGLQAAHVEGVIHRDLKPSNIMRDASGRVVIMDFGLAKTVQSDGMTQTGMMIGTMEYMSPEQAMGSELDARSDIFAVGLIFYELITGNMPYRADSAIASLVKRTQEKAIPLQQVDPTVPPAVSQIVAKCLERDPKNRYATVQELLDDLDIAQGKRPRSSGTGHAALRNSALAGDLETLVEPSPPVPQPAMQPKPTVPRKWMVVAAAVLVAVLGVGGYYAFRGKVGSTAKTSGVPATSVAIFPYYNQSGDPSQNWLSTSIPEMLSSQMPSSSGIRVISEARVQQVLRDLKISPQQQDPGTIKHVAEFVNANTVVFGKYQKVGDQIQITSTVYDTKRDSTSNIVTNVPTEKDLPGIIPTLAQNVREKLTTTSEMLRAAQAPLVLTKSVPALKTYDEGLQLYRATQFNEAISKFEEATAEDPNFAMAYLMLAQGNKVLGHDNEAQVASRTAVTISESANLPSNQKLLIQANNEVISNNTDKAIAAYERLTAADPNATDAQFELAKLYESVGNYDAARQRLTIVRDADKNNPDVLLASGRLEIRLGNYQAGVDFLSPAYFIATRMDNKALKASILQTEGIAYEKLNNREEALKNLNEALTIRRSLKLDAAAAGSLNEIANIEDEMGDSANALAHYKESLELRRNAGDTKGIALSLLNLGAYYNNHSRYPEALKTLNEALTKYRDLNDQSYQAICLMDIGTAQFQLGDYQAALTNYKSSLEIREKLKETDSIPESLHNLGETYVKLGQYDVAIAQYLKAIEIARAAGDQNRVALVSTSLGELYALQGQYDKALNSYQEAVKGFEAVNDHTYWRAAALSGYGNVLSMIGKEEEGRQKLQQGLSLATDLKNDTYVAQALNWLGDSYMYSGSFGDAKQQYEKAMAVATRANDREQGVIARFGLARLEVIQGRGGAAVSSLQKLVQETESAGLQALSVQASVYLAEALIAADKREPAQQQVYKALNQAEKLELILEQARAHYLLGMILSVGSKSTQYDPEFKKAVRLLESVSQQPGVGRLLFDRADLKGIYQGAVNAYQGAA